MKIKTLTVGYCVCNDFHLSFQNSEQRQSIVNQKSFQVFYFPLKMKALENTIASTLLPIHNLGQWKAESPQPNSKFESWKG